MGIGAVLPQLQSGQEKVISYASKTLSASQRRYCVTYRELLAIVIFVKQFRHYLLGRKFKVRTDHASLKWLSRFKDAEGMVGRWVTYLSTFNFELEHRKGSLHGNADALSRKAPKKLLLLCKQDSCQECQLESGNGSRTHDPPEPMGEPSAIKETICTADSQREGPMDGNIVACIDSQAWIKSASRNCHQ